SVLHKALASLRRPEVASPLPKAPSEPPKLYSRQIDRAGAARVPSHRCFRVLFIVRPGPTEALCTRYRGYNIMEALRLAGVEADHLDDRRIPERLEEVLAFDLVVTVRCRWSPEIAQLLDFAGRFSIPVICDLDDYLFDEEVLPYSDFLRAMPLEQS